MRISRIYLGATITVALLFMLMAGCTASRSSAGSVRRTETPSSTSTSQQTRAIPAPVVKIPTGDIPDSQAFVTYASATGHYQLEVPEGWARTVKGADVTFVSKLDGLSVHLLNTQSAPTVDSIRSGPVASLEANGTAVVVTSIKSVMLRGGSAIELKYHSNSAPDPVTGKRVRLENDTYFYHSGNSLAELRLWAPQGADNVDQWRRISSSFSWSK